MLHGQVTKRIASVCFTTGKGQLKGLSLSLHVSVWQIPAVTQIYMWMMEAL